ncbi:hypothetical protein ATS75_12415 [Pseudoalteromonas sp. H105]|nr:hypothetical protein ATS75_12415 [Pseudoalteromonas sp. H105]
MSVSYTKLSTLGFIKSATPIEQDLLCELESCDDIDEVLSMLLFDETLSLTFRCSIKKHLKAIQIK